MTPISRRGFLSSAVGAAGLLLVPPRLRGEAAAANDWPCHGCGPAQTRWNAVERSLGEEAAARLELRWAFDAGSGITATPAVVGHRVIVGSWDGRLYALDRSSGKQLWAFDAGVRTYPPNRRLGIFAAAAVMGERVFVACDRMIALELASGRPLWQRSIGDPDRTYEYFWAPPLAYEGKVYAGVSAGSETESRGRVVCLDAGSGEVLWTFYTAQPDVAGGSLIAPPSLDAAARTLYAATGNPFHPKAGPLPWTSSLVALEAATGRLRWGDQVHPHDVRNLDLNCPPMLLSAGSGASRRHLVVVGGKDGIRAWDRDRRARLWHVQLTPARPPGGGDEALPTTGPEAGPTAVAGETIFFASNNHADKTCLLAAIDAASGEIRWLHSLPAFQFGPLSVAGGIVYLGLVDGKLRAWRAADGAPLWESPAGQAIAGGPAIARGMVFVGTGAGEFLPGNKLLAFAPRGSSPS